MSSSRVDIRDVAMLDELVREFERAGSQMSHIDADVRVHLNNVMDDLQRQLNVIDGRLRDAEHRLTCAQSALSACQASAQAAAAVGMCQTCIFEEQEVAMARMEVEKWRSRYSRGEQIIGQCRQEISGYESGAHQLVERMCNEQTPHVSRQLFEHIDKLQDIMNSNMAPAYLPTAVNAQTVATKESQVPVHKDSCFDDFRKNIRGSVGDTVSQPRNQSLLRPARFV